MSPLAYARVSSYSDRLDTVTEAALHTHFSATAALSAFLGVLVFGTLWRLIAAHFVNSSNVQLQRIGQAMAFQY